MNTLVDSVLLHFLRVEDVVNLGKVHGSENAIQHRMHIWGHKSCRHMGPREGMGWPIRNQEGAISETVKLAHAFSPLPPSQAGTTNMLSLSLMGSFSSLLNKSVCFSMR